MLNIIMVIVNAISIFLASWLTVRLALQKFYAQKWWEKIGTAPIIIDILSRCI